MRKHRSWDTICPEPVPAQDTVASQVRAKRIGPDRASRRHQSPRQQPAQRLAKILDHDVLRLEITVQDADPVPFSKRIAELP